MAGDLPGAHWDEIQNDVFLLHFGGPTSSAEVEPFLIELFEDPFYPAHFTSRVFAQNAWPIYCAPPRPQI